MDAQIAVVVEKGMLRPLNPLNLPENTQLEIQIISPKKQSYTRVLQARQALLDAEVIQSSPSTKSTEIVTDAELLAAAELIGAAGPLSNSIINERNGR